MDIYKKTTSFVCMFLTISLTGCVAMYVQPPKGTNTAQIVMSRAGTDMYSVSIYSAFGNDSCVDTPGMGRIMAFSWAAEPTGKAVIAAGQRTYIRSSYVVLSKPVGLAYSPNSSTPGLKMRSSSCSLLSSFIPEAGHTYEAKLIANDLACSASIVDAESKLPPPTLSEHPIPESCREK